MSKTDHINLSESITKAAAKEKKIAESSNYEADFKTSLDSLPFDIFIKIVEYLNYRDMNMLAQVNHKLYTVVNDNLLWKMKLTRDIKRWRMLDSKTYPKELFLTRQISNSNNSKIYTSRVFSTTTSELDERILYKKVYMNACPDLVTKKEILKKLETFQQVQGDLHLTSTSENTSANSFNAVNNCNNITLSSLSFLVMPMTVVGQIKDFLYRNVFNSASLADIQHENNSMPKLVMFGPGLETTTSCLVTNILWKSEFKTIGMIPGRDGYGSGIKLKLFNHRPFNLTILYTNVSKVRRSNENHEVNLNRLIVAKGNVENEYELHPQVRETCANASGFIYVVDTRHMASLEEIMNESVKFGWTSPSSAGNIHNLNPIENYKLELNVLMKEVNPSLPLLILGCNADMQQPENLSRASASVMNGGLSCVQIIEKLELFNLGQEWQIRNCNLFQHKLKEIVLGFEWILNKLDQNILIQQFKAIHTEAE